MYNDKFFLLVTGLTILTGTLILFTWIVPEEYLPCLIIAVAVCVTGISWTLWFYSRKAVDLVSSILSPVVLCFVLLSSATWEVIMKIECLSFVVVTGKLFTEISEDLKIISFVFNGVLVVVFSKFSADIECPGAILMVFILIPIIGSFQCVIVRFHEVETAIEILLVIVLGIAMIMLEFAQTSTISEEGAEVVAIIAESLLVNIIDFPASLVVMTFYRTFTVYVATASTVVIVSMSKIPFMDEISSLSLPVTIPSLFVAPRRFLREGIYFILGKMGTLAPKLLSLMCTIYLKLMRQERCKLKYIFFVPASVVLITMLIVKCSPLAINVTVILMIVSTNIYISIGWKYLPLIPISVFLSVTSKVRTVIGTLVVYGRWEVIVLLWLLLSVIITTISRILFDGLFNTVSEWTDHLPATIVRMLIELFVLATAYFTVIILFSAVHLSLNIIEIVRSTSWKYLGKWCSIVLTLLLPATVSPSLGLISIVGFLFSVFLVQRVKRESDVWAVILATGVGVSMSLVSVNEIGSAELVTLAVAVWVIVDTNATPLHAMTLSK